MQCTPVETVRSAFLRVGARSASLRAEGGGSKDRPDNVEASYDQLEAVGINAAMFVSDGTAHEWQTWRRSLHAFAPLLFRE